MQQVRKFSSCSPNSLGHKRSHLDSSLLLDSETFTKGLGGFMEKCPQLKAAGNILKAKYFFQLPYVFQIIQLL